MKKCVKLVISKNW